MKRKSILLLAGLMLVSFLAYGCGNKETQTAPQANNNQNTATTSTPQKGGTVRYAIWSSPKGVFHPTLYNDIYDGRVNQLVYSTLLTIDENNKFVPNLAESYEVSSDNLTITFKLNKKAKWHDGQPVTAADVAYTFTTIADPAYTGPRFGEIDKIAGAQDYHDKKADKISGIKIIDDNTISFTYSEIFAPALANFSIRAIIPKHIWEKVPVADWDKQTDLLKNPIGSGPFKMSKFVPDQYVELVKNDDYFLGAPNLDKFILKVSNQDTAQSELIKGDLDIAALSSLKQKDIDTYKSSGMTVYEFTGAGYQFMTENLNNEFFKDKKVRQALVYAINRKAMVDKLLEGHGALLNTPFIPSSWAYPKDGLNTYDYNLDKAKQLLKEAGWENKNGILEKGGKQFKVTLKYPTGNKVREQSAPIIQQNLKDVGIDVQLASMDFATLKADVSDKHDYELALMGFSLELDPADAKTYWLSSIANKPGFNLANFVNEKSDSLLAEGAKYLDQDKRKASYQEWAKLMNNEVPFVYLYDQNEGRAYTPKLKGYKPLTYVEFPNVEKWYFEK